MSGLKELLIEEMQDVLHAESQLVKALPKMAKAAHDPKMKQAFERHLQETEGQVQRLEQAFELLGAKPKTKVCKAMQGLVGEGQEEISEGKQKDASISDLALAASAQKIEHYEISAYGTLRTMAEKIGETKVAKLLSDTLSEEEKTDQLLTQLCAPLLDEALQGGGMEGEEEGTTRTRAASASKGSHSKS